LEVVSGIPILDTCSRYGSGIGFPEPSPQKLKEPKFFTIVNRIITIKEIGMFNWYEWKTEMEIAQERYEPLRQRRNRPARPEKSLASRWTAQLGRVLVTAGCALQRRADPSVESCQTTA
jgi:hypothetical protein